MNRTKGGIPGFRKERVVTDFMHTAHLGVFQHVCGSALVELCQTYAFGPGALKLQLAEAWRQFKAWCARNSVNCSMECFTPDRCNLNSKSKVVYLKSKAFNCRVLLSWLQMLCSSRLDTDHAKLRSTCLYHLCTYQHLQDLHGEFLEADEASLMYSHGYSFLFAYEPQC